MSEVTNGTAAATPVNTAEPIANAVESKPVESQKGETLLTEGAKADAVTETKEGDANTQAVKTDPVKIELKLPEGSFLSESKLNQLREFAEANKLTQKQAETLLESENSAVSDYHQNLLQEHDKRTQEWVTQIKSDQEIGGAKFDENVKLARQMIADFATPEFKNDLSTTGFGSHPGLVKLIVKMGRTIEALKSEDGMVRSNEPPKPQKSIADILYDKT